MTPRFRYVVAALAALAVGPALAAGPPLVPPDCGGFVSVRLAEVLRKCGSLPPPTALCKEYGLDAADLKRFVVFAPKEGGPVVGVQFRRRRPAGTEESSALGAALGAATGGSAGRSVGALAGAAVGQIPDPMPKPTANPELPLPAIPCRPPTTPAAVALTVANVRKEAALLFEMAEDGKTTFRHKVEPGEAIDVKTNDATRWVAFFAAGPTAESFDPKEAKSVWLLRPAPAPARDPLLRTEPVFPLNRELAAQEVVVPVPPWTTERIEKKYTPAGDYRTPILPPVIEGQPPPCAEPPADEQVLLALRPLATGIPGVYEESREDVRITTERIVDRLDEVRFFPLVGPARLHRCQWKCVVTYTLRVEASYPFPFCACKPVTEVVYVDVDHLHACPGDPARMRDLLNDLKP